MKNTMTGMKNTLEGINNRLDDTEEKISDRKTEEWKSPNQNSKREKEFFKMRIV